MNNVCGKAPDEDTDENAIDIYLFSNGEETMPPRKYHIHQQELDMWDITRSLLAHSHYGIPNSMINVYTLDGVKIDNPFELKSGFTYVAVEQNDDFLPAKYENYILRASRSIEKRKEKLLELAAANNIQDKPGNEFEVVKEITTSIYNKNICLPEVEQSITTDKVTIQKRMTSVKPAPKTIQRKSFGSASSKSNDSKSIKGYEQRIVPNKKIVPIVNIASTAPTPKRSALKKPDAITKENMPNFKMNDRAVTSDLVNVKGKTNESIRNVKNLITHKGNKTPSVVRIEEKESICSIYSTDTNKTPVSIAIEHLYKNSLDPIINLASKASDIMSDVGNFVSNDKTINVVKNKCFDKCNMRVTEMQTQKDEQVLAFNDDHLQKLIAKVFEESLRNKPAYVKINDAAVGNSIGEISKTSLSNKNDGLVSGNTAQNSCCKNDNKCPFLNKTVNSANDNDINSIDNCDSKLVTKLNKGETVNIQLSIHLNEHDGTLSITNEKNKSSQKDLRFEKASQTDMEVTWTTNNMFNKKDKNCFCEKNISLQSLFSAKADEKNKTTFFYDENVKNMMLVQCLCSPSQDKDYDGSFVYKTDINPVCRENRDIVVLTACERPHKVQCCISCGHAEEIKEEKKESKLVVKSESKDVVIEKTSLLTVKYKTNSNSKEKCTICKDLKQEEECKKFEVKQCEDQPENHKIQYYIRRKDSPTPSTMSDEKTAKEYMIIKNIVCKTCPRSKTDAFTQTNLCNTLLEVCQQPDGHYSFYLPSLQFLKCHKL